jgi:hypothetical protein
VADDDSRARPGNCVFVRYEEPAEGRLDAKHIEVVAGYDEAAGHVRFATTPRRNRKPGIVRHRQIVERRDALPEHLVVLPRGGNPDTLPRPERDPNQLGLRSDLGEGTEEDAVHQREGCCRCRDADRQAAGDGAGEAAAGREAAKRITGVLVDPVEEPHHRTLSCRLAARAAMSILRNRPESHR